ncbi:MAG: FadR family transcriptional regulator [Christensenellaceae bacterium]|nr:FadR family transcriptional regulator [Christensenellaceae bacterium]MBR3842588.1 FadR family transcriptional regulator [Christensenellaceae bacterium]
MLTPLKKTKLYEEISKQIISLINSGELKPGDKLPPERSLAEQLNVSRTAIREALRALESMGYIESKVGGGTFVREISLENIISPVSAMFQQDESLLKDLIAVRLLLETEMASLAAKHITPEKAMKIEEAIVLMRKEVAKGEIGLRGDNSFHAALAEASGNSAMSLISDMCMELLSKTRLATLELENQPEQSLSEHIMIYEAVIAGDSRLAAKRMKEHLNNANKNLSKRKSKQSQEK